MDLERLHQLVEMLGARKVTVKGGSVTSCCVFHDDRTPSMTWSCHGTSSTNNQYGDGPWFFCFGCKKSGGTRAIKELVYDLMRRHPHPLQLVEWVEYLESEEAPVPTLADRIDELEYVGSGRKPVAKRDMKPVVMPRVTTADGRPWFDYLAVFKADQTPALEESSYAPFKGSVPQYAYDRGLTPETCKAWELGNDTWKKRLLFPLRDRNKRLMAVSGRLYEQRVCVRCRGPLVIELEGGERVPKFEITEEQKDRAATAAFCGKCGAVEPPKYMHSKGFKRNLMLYGEHMMDPKYRTGYVVEGHLDVVVPWQYGYRNVFGLLGSGPGQSQIERLVMFCDRVVTIGDGDAAGRGMNAKVAEMINGRIPVESRELPDGRDPGGLTREEALAWIGPPECP
jgi:hypothetical protein